MLLRNKKKKKKNQISIIVVCNRSSTAMAKKYTFCILLLVGILFVCFEVLRPSQQIRVMTIAVILSKPQFPGQALSSKRLASTRAD